MKKPILFGILGLLLIAATYFAFFKKTARPFTEVTWNQLAEFDYTQNSIPDSLKKLDQNYVRIPGFMVPLEDGNKLVTEFLLVPSPQACIHVPAPPPNQMVYAKIKNGVTAAFGPVWIYGKLTITTKGSKYGDSAYQMEADKVENYE